MNTPIHDTQVARTGDHGPGGDPLRRWGSGAISALIAVSLCAGLTSPVRGADNVAPPRYDRATLSDITRDVLRHKTGGRHLSVAEPTMPAVTTPEESPVAGAPDTDTPARDLAPAREGISVAIPPSSSPSKKTEAPAPDATGYQSNTWRQRPAAKRALTFSSGALAPVSGLDPALKARADGLRAQGRQFVYGFVLPDGPVDEALEQKLSGLGVELLGRHDDHYKARLPVGSLHAIAAMPGVEWIGLSSPKQKVSSELAELRSSHGKAAVDGATPIPIVVNLFDDDEAGNFRRQLEAVGAAVGEYDAELQFYRAVATGPVIDQITALDFVLFVELVGMTTAAHSESMALIDADVIRPGSPFGHTRFGGLTIPIGIMDSGFAIGAGGHVDLNQMVTCGQNFTTDPGTAYNDPARHGSHVLGTIAGRGYGDPRYVASPRTRVPRRRTASGRRRSGTRTCRASTPGWKPPWTGWWSRASAAATMSRRWWSTSAAGRRRPRGNR